MNYAFEYKGKGYMPDGEEPIPADKVAEHNQELERAELMYLTSHPEKLFLYVKEPSQDYWNAKPNSQGWQITTWLGTIVSTHCHVGYRVPGGFGFHTYKRSVDCRIFGTRYVGWYHQSSGSYCRLRKAKKQ